MKQVKHKNLTETEKGFRELPKELKQKISFYLEKGEINKAKGLAWNTLSKHRDKSKNYELPSKEAKKVLIETINMEVGHYGNR